ncbi:hypothetical protein LHV16_02195 [Providencia rettgeri]|uniref:phage tail fiber protein n=1 Tax=Providencia rettgeri TaxID=587 RepID=UPI001CFF1DFB|nr:hypothetical protein [Providencia rettgeri]MCB4826058.1 hypothetical protein [Providencia rettgeri]MCG5388322.1 hypothetical protein [Providencia rettgeri]MCG9946712.1 hypothetical protein [Providencia rettgeri]MDW7801090.1 hypothetical protein [Providencia rettgeri]
MYNTGTVTTTANSTKLVGAGTKWLNNINRVSAEQAIQIQIGTTVHNNSIQSIQSDTELTLNFPLPVAATGAKYVILTTMVHSVSDAMNKIVSMNVSNVQFSDILTRWMTEQGIITVTLPDQTTQQLRTTKEMDKQLDGKFDKTGGDINGIIKVKSNTPSFGFTNNYPGMDLCREDLSYLRIEAKPATHQNSLEFIQKNDKGALVSHIGIPNRSGTAMLVGDYGWGGNGATVNYDEDGLLAYIKSRSGVSRVFRNDTQNTTYSSRYSAVGLFKSDDTFTALSAPYDGKPITIIGGNHVNAFVHTLYTNRNTTKDANGNLKAASPIIRVFADHVDPNEEAEGVTLKKLHTGIYQLHGVLGLHSDASWGGINGGITIPCGINQLPLVYALYDVLEKGKLHPFDGRIVEPDEDGDIVLYTSYRQHDLPQNIQYERFKLYPEFLRDATEDEESIPGFDGKVELTPGEPCDIPVGHWVDVRVNMPSNSIYNQKQAEADRLAKIEAERLAQEEAKRAAEEAERAEQEAAEQVEQQ